MYNLLHTFRNKRVRRFLYSKTFSHFDGELCVDFNAEKLIYPEEIKGRERNDGFDAPENFVVFECVNKLLDKGYRPEHIELEKEWHLGHDAKSGRADICVSSPDGDMLFIVECKTYGKEFDKAYKDTNSDGAQLFSYWQQERATKWLVLYASDIADNEIVWKAPTISCQDDPNVIISAKKDKTVKLFETAHTAVEKHNVWKETYSLKWYDDLVFSPNSVAYKIGLKPLLKKDLKDFTPDDKIVNRFEEILRHNNVSDKENAFNRLVALFICKLVDEINKNDDDEVEFQYKQGTDTYETLQDRLQRKKSRFIRPVHYPKKRWNALCVGNPYTAPGFSIQNEEKRKKKPNLEKKNRGLCRYWQRNGHCQILSAEFRCLAVPLTGQWLWQFT